MPENDPNWRRGTIGGSDVAGILGLSPWSSPWSVWAETVGLAGDDHDDETKQRFAAGHDAEPYLALQFERYHRDRLTPLFVLAEQTRLEDGWKTGHADGLVFNDMAAKPTVKNAVAGWEGKTDRDWKPWDEVPAHYLCQAQWYMHLSGLERWYFTVGFSGWKTAHYVVERNEADIAMIVDRATEFYESFVLTGNPPPVDDHHATAEAVAHVYREADADERIDADDELIELVKELDGVKRHIRFNEKRADALATDIRARLGSAVEAIDGDEPIVSWRPQSRESFDRKAAVAALEAAGHDPAEFTTTKTFRVMRTHLKETIQ